MSSLAQYKCTIHQWRKKYGVPPPDFKANLTKTRTSCAKKGCQDRRTQRHHTGNDFWFALLLPDVFAKRYIEFHKDDVAPLCEKHHVAVHKIYKKMMQEVYYEYNKLVEAGTSKEMLAGWAKDWMDQFRARFKKWKKVKVHTARRKRKKRKHI